ncbi:TIR-like protein FxsC [Micromonospora zhanjiangensis]|uniref:TIR-like protein FxsC n=1 Tax=Micromonospora zhanjiangensis TaxID=1522057 RepID=A0ABV8KJI2_9ACTN
MTAQHADNADATGAGPAGAEPVGTGRSDAAPVAGGLYFFLSYARSGDDPYVQQFYRDLCSEVRVRAGLASTEEVGFLDSHSIDIGSTWSVDLVEALSECRSFLALCSPRYFLSEPCGREWQIFDERLARHERNTGARSNALLPVFWLPPRRVPEAVSRRQYDNEAFSDAYRRDGLRQLMRLSRNRDEYLDMLSILADRIVENALVDPLPPVTGRTVDFEDARSAFHTPGERNARELRRISSVARSDHVDFLVVAPSRQEAGVVRRRLEFYGDTSEDWAPYLPSLPGSLASFAREVAAKVGLTSDVLPIQRSAEPGRAGRRIVVLLVDAWSTQLEAYRRALTRQENRGTPAATAMVPRSHEDSETHENWRWLSDGLRSVFLDRVAAGESLAYRADILTHRAFDEDLQVVLEVARNRIFAQAGPPAAETDRGGPPRPILEGP